MSEEHIWAVHDIIVAIVGISIIIGLVVYDILFCNSFHGFCALRWSLSWLGGIVYNGVPLIAKPFVWGVLRMIDSIPL
jgi:hypothetical protein